MADDLIPNQIIALVSIIVGTLCIYGSELAIIGGVLSIIAAILATIFGTNTLRHLGKYSLGTGVPSIVYLLTTVGLVAYLTGMMLSYYLEINLLLPITSIVAAAIIAGILSMICKYLFNIQVEILTKSFISIAVSSVLLLLSLSNLIAQSLAPMIIYENVIQTGIIILLMIFTVMVLQNPYNSCMGYNEDQYRTLALAVSNIFLMLMIVSIISLLNTEYWIIYLLISMIGWAVFFRQYSIYTKQQAASIKRFGLWPTNDGED